MTHLKLQDLTKKNVTIHLVTGEEEVLLYKTACIKLLDLEINWTHKKSTKGDHVCVCVLLGGIVVGRIFSRVLANEGQILVYPWYTE